MSKFRLNSLRKKSFHMLTLNKPFWSKDEIWTWTLRIQSYYGLGKYILSNLGPVDYCLFANCKMATFKGKKPWARLVVRLKNTSKAWFSIGGKSRTDNKRRHSIGCSWRLRKVQPMGCLFILVVRFFTLIENHK